MGLLSMKMIVNGILGCVSCLKKDVELVFGRKFA